MTSAQTVARGTRARLVDGTGGPDQPKAPGVFPCREPTPGSCPAAGTHLPKTAKTAKTAHSRLQAPFCPGGWRSFPDRAIRFLVFFSAARLGGGGWGGGGGVRSPPGTWPGVRGGGLAHELGGCIVKGGRGSRPSTLGTKVRRPELIKGGGGPPRGGGGGGRGPGGPPRCWGARAPPPPGGGGGG
jgi:hypothetical protein